MNLLALPSSILILIIELLVVVLTQKPMLVGEAA
jgi:hypothetical protein